MKKLMVAVAVAGAMAFGAYADSSRSITVTAYNRGTDGVVESVDLAFGECADDYVGDLYVAYGYTAGDDLTPTNGWDHYEQLSDTITAEVTSYHYDMPEGWSESFYHLKFFLFTKVAGKEYKTVKDYYVQEGLIAMLDGEDNAGTGTHDANAATWIDLTGNGYDIPVADYMNNQLDSWYDKSLKAKSCGNVPWAKNCYDYVTIEIAAKYDGKGSVMFSSGNKENFKLVAISSGTVQFNNLANQNYAIGDSTFLQAAAVYSPDATKPVVYTFGVSANRTSTDTWGWKSATTCLGRGDANSAQFTGEYYAIRLYDRALTPVEIAANSAIDQARFMGRGTLPESGEESYVLSGVSDLIKRDAYVTLSLDKIDEPTEIDISARLTLGGFDLGARAFDIYAVFGDNTEQKIASGVKMGDSFDATVDGLKPEEIYSVRFYARDSTLSSAMTEEHTFGTAKVVIHPAQMIEGGRSISVRNFKTKHGYITGVDLSFGDCPDDWTGDLYVAYGPRSGADLQALGWDAFEKISSVPITAEDKSFHYDMPESWRVSVWSLRFFFKSRASGYVNASSYYVQDGLMAMWDGLDNVGTGTHDANAGTWVDLSGNGCDIPVASFMGTQLQGWSDKSLKAPKCYNVPVAKSCKDYKTIEILAKYSSGILFNSGDGLKKLVAIRGQTVQFYSTANQNYSIGDSTYLQAAAVHSPDETLPVVYVNGDIAVQTSSDTWGGNSSGTCLGRGANSSQFSGEYYVIRLYDRALTPAEIKQNYRADCIRYRDAEGELTVVPADRCVLTSSSETIYAGKMMGGLIFLIVLK